MKLNFTNRDRENKGWDFFLPQGGSRSGEIIGERYSIRFSHGTSG